MLEKVSCVCSSFLAHAFYPCLRSLKICLEITKR
jgi:hypothetical protein